jgi:hypothetical protein
MAIWQPAGPCCTTTTTGTPAAVRAVPHRVAEALAAGGWVPPCAPGPEEALRVGPQPAAALTVSTASANTATAREDMGDLLPAHIIMPCARGRWQHDLPSLAAQTSWMRRGPGRAGIGFA